MGGAGSNCLGIAFRVESFANPSVNPRALAYIQQKFDEPFGQALIT